MAEYGADLDFDVLRAKEASETVRVPVVGGLCELEFVPGHSTGRDDDTQPGVGFVFLSHSGKLRPGKDGEPHWAGVGVIGRRHAAALRDMLDRFLRECPPEAG